MAFLNTLDNGQYSPTCCIRGGVVYSQEVLLPDSGLYNQLVIGQADWSYYNSMPYHNSRINGRYDLEQRFNQGYFNFENWSGQIVYSAYGSKSGFNQNVGPTWSGSPYLVNFWGRGDTNIGRTALYNYGFANNGIISSPKVANITTCVVMSGLYNPLDSGRQQTMQLYTGYSSTDGITIFGRVGSTNPKYEFIDNIFSLGSPDVIADPQIIESPTMIAATKSIGFGGGGTDGGSTWFDSPVGDKTLEALGDDKYTYRQSGISGVGDLLIGIMSGQMSIPSNAHIVGAKAAWYKCCEFGQTQDYLITMSVSGVESNNMSQGAIWYDFPGQFFANPPVFRKDEYGNESTTWGLNLTPDLLNNTEITLRLRGYRAQTEGLEWSVADYATLNFYYILPTAPNPPQRLALRNKGTKDSRYLSWNLKGFDTNIMDVDLQFHHVLSNKFSNFIFTHNPQDGMAYFYTAHDDEPFTLMDIRYLGNIDKLFDEENISFYDDSYIHSDFTINNPKIISQFGIDGRYWNNLDITAFNQYRLNPGYFIDNSLSITPPTDDKYLNFHFPIKSSGNLGSSHPTNYTATNYYVPLTSGISDRLYEFDMSTFNPTTITLNGWIENIGTNPSGYFGARVEFCNAEESFGRMLFTPVCYWSGFPIEINNTSPISIRMSGLLFDTNDNRIDSSTITLDQANHAELYIGAWYRDIGREYYGDINLYSARIYMDSFLTVPQTGNALTLYTSGQPLLRDSLDLYLQNGFIDGGTDLFIHGLDTVSSGCDLYIAGGFKFGQIPLYIGGMDSANDNTTLFIEGSTIKSNMPLYIYSQPPSEMSGNIPLSMWATEHSGISNGISLFIGENAPSGIKSNGMNLYVIGPQSERLTSSMNLFLRRNVLDNNSSVTLYCHNEFTNTEGELTLFMNAPSGTLGAVPVSGQMNLFIARTEGIQDGIDLMIKGPEGSEDGIPMIIEGGPPSYSSIPLITDGIGVDYNTLKIYINGF